MTDIHYDASTPAQLGSFGKSGNGFIGVAQAIASPFRLLVTWQTRITERHRLATLEPRLLQDAGISAAEVGREVRKPFWLA